MKTKGRLLSLILAFFMLASILTVLPPLEVKAAKSDCESPTCTGCDVTCSFNPSRSMYWGETLEFSGKITSDKTIQKVTVKAFDIDNPDKYVFQIFTNQSVGETAFYLNNVPDFIAGESLSENWDGVTIVIYAVLEGETGVHHQFEYDIKFKEAEPDCNFSPESSYCFGEELDFSGKVTCDTNIEKVTVGIYDIEDPGDASRAIHYYSKEVNKKSFSLDNIPSFEIGDYLNDYRSGKTGIDTSTYKGIVIIVYVAYEDFDPDAYEEFSYTIQFEGSDVDCTFSPENSYKVGEKLEFSGDITCDTTISKVTVGIYDKNAPGNSDRAIHYYSQNVNAKSFSLSNIPAFTIGGYLDDYRSDSDGIDTSGYEGIIIVIYVAGDNIVGENIAEKYKTFEYVVDFESSNLECSFSPKDSYSMGETFDFSGTITCDTTISKITVGIYDKADAGDADRSIHYYTTTVNSKTFSLSNIPAFTVGDFLNDYRDGEDGIDTSDYEGIIIVIYVAGDNIVGENIAEKYKMFEYVVTFVRNANTLGDINSDGQITNKDRFWLNRYLNGMDVPANFDKTMADINGDGDVDQKDAEFLSRYLAGWVGYEQLPDLDSGTSACVHAQYTDTYYNTVFVSTTVKINSTHTYYHVYNRSCSCGVNLGQVHTEMMSDDHDYDENGLCACGAYDNASYESWTGVNVSGAIANVYSTPTATARYGYINKGEVVTVLGEYGDKYLIEYQLDGGNGIKQGYVDQFAISSLESQRRNEIVKEIDDTFLNITSKYERYDDLAKDEISINFFDLMFADITDLGGVVEKCLDLGDGDIVNSKHAVTTLMDSMDDTAYVAATTECVDVVYVLYDWIQKTPYDEIESFFEGAKDQARVIAVMSDIKAIKIDNTNNALGQGMEYLFECGLDNDAVLEKYAEILTLQLNNLDKKAALQKVTRAANTFGDVVGSVLKALDKIAKPLEAINAFYDIALRDYTVELAKLNVLEAICQEHGYTHLLIAVRELKSEMENEFSRAVAAAQKLAIEKALKFVLNKTNGLWAIVASGVELTVGQDAMAKRDACYILEIEDATYWYIKSLMYSYEEDGNVETLKQIKQALHAYTDCKVALNSLAIELNTWGIFVTDKDKYDYLSIYKYWYSHQHDDIDALFQEFEI